MIFDLKYLIKVKGGVGRKLAEVMHLTLVGVGVGSERWACSAGVQKEFSLRSVSIL